METDKDITQLGTNVPANCSVFIWGMFFDQEHKIFIPTKIKELEGKDVVEVKSGGFFYLCRTRDSKLYGWGTTKYCKFGFAGQDTYVPRLIPFNNKVTMIATGNWHSILVDDSGDLYAVGHNKYGACGNGTFDNLTEFTKSVLSEKVTQIAAGDGVSLIINDKGELYSCGHRERHGHKTADHISKPAKLKFDSKIIKVAAGFTHCLVVEEEGKTYSWGQGNCFQLGHGKKDDQKQPRLIKGLQGVHIVDVSCTRGEKNSHSMAVDKNGVMYTWGAGYKGKLGHYEEWNHSDPADEPVPKKVNLPYKVIKCCAGGIHSMLVNQDREAMSFGCGSDGRIGHEESKDHRYLYRQGKPRKIETFNDYKVEGLECSYYHNICLVSKKK